MARNNPINRRDFLRMAGLGTLSMLSGGTVTTLLSGCSRTITPELNVGGTAEGELRWEPDVELLLKATPEEVQIFPGRPTEVWT